MPVVNEQSKHSVSVLATLVLIFTLLQGTSTSLSLVYHFSRPLEPVVSQLWLLGYAVASLALMVNFGLNWVTWIVRYRLLLTLLLLGTAFSAMWSMDAGLTIERTVHLVGSTIIAFYIGFSIPLTRILSVSSIVMGLLMLASIVFALFLPQYGIENYEGQLVWRGVMASKNTLGFWSATSVLLLAVMMHNVSSFGKQVLCGIGILMSLVALLLSESATSLLAMLVAALLMSYLYIANRFTLGLISMLVMGTLFAALAIFAFLNIDTNELVGRSGDLTGRGEVWQQTWKLILEKPLTGYGYGTIWYPTLESLWIQQSLTDFTWKVFHAHNGFLQLASEIGLPLTFLALLMVIQQMIEIVYCQYQRQQAGVLFVLGFTIALLVSNYSEARFLVNRELYWIFFIALPISMLQQVSMIVNQPQFQPIPAPLTPLHKRTREKVVNNAQDRQHRQRLKAKLRTRLLEGHVAANDTTAQQKVPVIIDQEKQKDSTNSAIESPQKTQKRQSIRR